MNKILRQGVVTPFVVFTFPTGFTVESSNSIPRYFVSLSHNRTCKKACTFNLTIVYVPDTFKAGRPYVIDQQLLSSVGGKVVYSYGYYDRFGLRHMQQSAYVGQIYTYDSDVNINSGTITYTISGCAAAVDLTTSMARIEATNEQVKPSEHLEMLIQNSTSGGFYDLKNVYEIDIRDKNDQHVYIPNFDSAPVLDLIMGTVTANSNDGVPVRKGGLVQLSNGPDLPSSIGVLNEAEQALAQTVLTGRNSINSESDARIFKESGKQQARERALAKLKQPFVCYIDDTETTSGKLGTLVYKCNTMQDSTAGMDNFFYYIGNNQQESDVLDFSVTYNAAKGLAAAKSTGKTVSAVDANGNAVGQTFAVTDVAALGKNVFDTLSGIEQNLLISVRDISQIMIYPFEATMKIIGQTIKNELLDVIHVTVYLNGTVHEILSGDYQILEIEDEISASGFTTQFKLSRRDTNNIPTTEVVSSTPTTGDAGDTNYSAMSTIAAPNTSQTDSRSRT